MKHNNQLEEKNSKTANDCHGSYAASSRHERPWVIHAAIGHGLCMASLATDCMRHLRKIAGSGNYAMLLAVASM